MGGIVDIASSCRYPATEFEDTGVCQWNGVSHVLDGGGEGSSQSQMSKARQNVNIVIVARHGLM